MLDKESSSQFDSTTRVKCLHNTRKGLAWKRTIHIKKLGFIPYTVIEKECQSCGARFLADENGVRLTD